MSNALKNRKIAFLIMIIMIAVSILYGSHRSLIELRDKTESTFLNGVYNDGFSIQSDLDAIVELAYNLNTIGKKYINENDTLIQNLMVARDNLYNAKTPSEKYKANKLLIEKVNDLYTTLGEKPLKETDEKYRGRIYTDIMSHNEIISHDPYNIQAEKFNTILNTFPANILRKLTFVSEAELYR